MPAPNNTADMEPLALTIPVPEARVALTQAHAAVLQGAIGRQRGVTQDTEIEVVVCPLQRKNEATVAFPISENRVEAYCVGYRVDKSEDRKKPEKPEGWLKYSRQDIATRINGAAYPQDR